MPSVPKPPFPASLCAALERLGVDVDAALARPSSSSAAAPPAPRAASAAVAGALEQLNRAQKRAATRAARDRLGHKHGARAKADKRRRLDRQRRADERYARRFRERSKPWLAAAAAAPRLIPRSLWLMAWDCVADATGAALRAHMRRESNQVALGAARRAALGCDEHDRDERRTWASEAARRTMTLALVELRLAVPDRMRGGWTGGVVRGIPQGALAALLTPPGTGAAAPHRNTLTGRHRGARSDRRRGEVGYQLALELAGFCFSRQPRITERDVQPFEVGPRGYSFKRYWIVSASPSAATSGPMRELLIALHRAGRLAVLGRPKPVQKPAFFRAQHPAPVDRAAPS